MFVHNVNARFVTPVGRASTLAWTLDAAEKLLQTIYEMRWYTPEDWMANDERVAETEAARMALLNGDGQVWHPLVTDRDGRLRLAEVFDIVVAVMHRHFPLARAAF